MQVKIDTVNGVSFVPSSISLDGTNTFIGLQTFSRAGSSSINLSTNPMAVFNKSSNTYGILALQDAGTTKAAIGWDVNGGLRYLASSFFTHNWTIGGTEYMQLTSSGLAINRAGGGPSATLDVNGTVFVTSIPSSSVAFVDGVSGYLTGDTNKLVYSASGFFGVNKPSASASGHFGTLTRTVGDISGLNYSVTPITTGFPVGFSIESYSAWAVRVVGGNNIYSSTASMTGASEPNINDFDINGGNASEASGSGYDMAVDTPPSYAVWALYDSGGCHSNSSVSFSLGFWSSGSGNTDVAVTINPPNQGTPSAYYIVRNGSDGQVVGGSFTDSNSGWSGGASPSGNVLQWAINLSWSSVTDASDYVINNTTNSSYQTTSGGTSIQDTNTGWNSGTPTTTPTSLDENSLTSDGTTQLCRLGGKFGMFAVSPVSQQDSSTEITLALQNYGALYPSGSGSYDGNFNSLTGAISNLGTATMSSFTSNGSSTVNGQLTITTNAIIAVAVPSVLQITLVINNTSTGTINNASTSGASTVVFTGASAQTITGFANPANGKFVFSANRATTDLTLKNENASSSAANRIITGTGGDLIIPPGSGFFIQYDNTSSRWRVSGIGIINLATGVSGRLGFANLTQGSALSVFGVAGNATADMASIVAASDYQVMRRSGTSIGFGAIDLSQSAAVTNALGYANGGSGQTTSRRLFSHFADAGNGTTVETDLYSDTITAAKLATNGDTIQAMYGGLYVSSATATRQIKIYFGGTAIFDTGALTLSLSAAWTGYVDIIRVSSSVVRYSISFTTEGAALAAYTAVGELTGLTLANTQVMKITGQAAGVGAATNDIVVKMGYIDYEPI